MFGGLPPDWSGLHVSWNGSWDQLQAGRANTGIRDTPNAIKYRYRQLRSDYQQVS